MSGPNHPRGTSNRNDRGNAKSRRERKQWLLDTFGDGTYVDCSHCGLELDFGTVTVDRIVAGCDGGTYARSNIRPSCLRCNSIEGSAHRDRRKKASKAVSARYVNPCSKCLAKAYEPCRSLTSGRVTDTHLVRVQEQFTTTRVGEWASD